MLIRHASVKEYIEKMGDFKIELSKEGIQQANQLSNWLSKNNFSIDTALASPAKRVEETANILFSSKKTNIIFKKSLYLCNLEVALNELSKIETKIETAALIGHEPTISEVLKFLISETRPDLNYVLKNTYPNAGLSVIHLYIDSWNRIEQRQGLLEAFICPKDFRR